jgi:hypothetical protein
MGTRGSLPAVKVARQHEADYSPPLNAEVKNVWNSNSAPLYTFTVWCLIKHRNNFNMLVEKVIKRPVHKAPVKCQSLQYTAISKIMKWKNNFNIFPTTIYEPHFVH